MSRTHSVLSRIILSTALTILFSILLGGCQVPILYSPPVVHAPIFEGAGEYEVDVFASSDGTDASISFSPINHLTLFANGSWHDSRSNHSAHAFHAYREFGLSGYARVSPDIHIQGGLGWGYGNGLGYGLFNDSAQSYWTESGDYSRFFGQGIFQFRVYKGEKGGGLWSDIGFAMRVVRVGFDSIVSSAALPQYDVSGWFFEPALILRSGYKFMEFEAQYGLRDPFGKTDIRVSDQSLSIGLRLWLNRLFKEF